MQEEKTKSKNPVWSFFSSVRLTIALLILIALAAVVGTVVPQQDAAGESLQKLPPALAAIVKALQVTDLYRSPWFLLLMGLLMANLVICSLNRLPASLRLYRRRPEPDRPGLYENLPPGRVLAAEGSVEDAADRMGQALEKSIGSVERKTHGGTVWLSAHRGAWSYFGVYVIHAGVLIIVLGAVIGSIFGFEGHVNIPAGGSADAIELRGGKGTMKLGFDVRCDDFTVEFYDSGMPKLYRSDLSFVKGGEVRARGSLMVNHPLEFEGIRFYQSTYGAIPGEAVLAVEGKGQRAVKRLRQGERFAIDGGKAQAEILRIEGNLMRMGPAVKIGITAGDKALAFWVFQFIDAIEEHNPGITKQVPQFNPALYRPYRFALEGIETAFYTGLKVNRDPGVPIVGAGAFVLVAGFLLTFFSSHRQVFVRVDRSDGKARISIAGRCNRDPVRLDREIGRAVRLYRGETP
ncbi:MAG: cytochrome c biogenesis protein ResB [Syntrophaceae bacterium]|nr:cytochrome c biogenesis protein ResB [Syntrophaceae bacterium]